MYAIGIVGATGAVGRELIAVLDRRRFPVKKLSLLASARSVGTTIPWKGEALPVAVAEPSAFEGLDYVFFAAGASRSRELAPAARAAGAVVIDNSSAFRMDDGIPLVVPEVNPGALDAHDGLIANPNCVAAILTVALAPLMRLSPIRRVVVSTYQSASGAGAAAMQELLDQTGASLKGEPVVPRVLKHPFAFNLFSHDSRVGPSGDNDEESKVIAETRKILGVPGLSMTATCVRVPVLRAHSESVNIEFEREVSEQAAREAISAAAGVKLVDSREENHFPMPLEASGNDDVLVGRIRRDPSVTHGLNMFLCGDQLLKGAALNAVQIAEELARRPRGKR